MDDQDGGLSIEGLAERVGMPVRTIRYYIAEGLLPGPGARGKAATYGDEHLARLRLIRRLVEQRVPLADVRRRLAHLTADDVVALLADADARAAELQRVADAPSPKAYVAALLRQAKRGRQQTPSPPTAVVQATATAPASVQSPDPASASVPSAAPLPASRMRAPGAAQGPDLDAGEAWLRLELAPGLELFVSAAAKERYRAVIEGVLRAASEPRGGDDTQRGREYGPK